MLFRFLTFYHLFEMFMIFRAFRYNECRMYAVTTWNSTFWPLLLCCWSTNWFWPNLYKFRRIFVLLFVFFWLYWEISVPFMACWMLISLCFGFISIWFAWINFFYSLHSSDSMLFPNCPKQWWAHVRMEQFLGERFVVVLLRCARQTIAFFFI